VFDMDSTQLLPDETTITSGTYKPTDHSDSAAGPLPDSYPAPAPLPLTTDLHTLNNKTANGEWKLFVHDDGAVGSGSITGWSLVIDTQVFTLPDPDPDPEEPEDLDPCATAPEDGFTDVPEGSTHEENIDCIVAYGVATGYGDGTYRPAVRTSRAQMASFVARTLDAAGVVLPSEPPDAFTDDEAAEAHEHRINQLAAVGVIGGNGEQGASYFPTTEMRRDHMASFLYNAYEAVAGEPLPDGPDAFTDDEGNPHEQEIDALAAADVLSGTGGGLYDPAGTVSRGQMASFLARFLDLLADEGFLTEDA
jgi:hypothetical protein